MNKFSHISIENHPASNILRHIRTSKVGRKIPWQTIYPAQWANNTEKEERHQHRWRQGKKCVLEKNEKQRVQFSVKPVLASGIRYVKKIFPFASYLHALFACTCTWPNMVLFLDIPL